MNGPGFLEVQPPRFLDFPPSLIGFLPFLSLHLLCFLLSLAALFFELAHIQVASAGQPGEEPAPSSQRTSPLLSCVPVPPPSYRDGDGRFRCPLRPTIQAPSSEGA